MHSARFVAATPGAEEHIVYCARVSNPANQNNHETAPRLLRYLINHKHWSPFEMASMTVEIETTRSIETQILRHRSFSFQSFSQRYSDVSVLPVFDVPQLRTQDKKNRQASHNNLDPDVSKYFTAKIADLSAECSKLYKEMLAAGIAKECARDILPLGTSTRLFMSGTLRSWIHYLDVRCDPSTQLEHRLVAESCKTIFQNHFPVIAQACWSIEA